MMKNVRLVKLSLTNYRNLDHIELSFDGKDCAIVGENHIGKTNTLESLFVLLDNTTIGNSAIIDSIKPLSDTKKVVSIDATFDVDGEEFSVRKDYGEDWVRTRGTDQLVMKGHFQKLFIQGVKIERSSEYYAKIREKFGIPATQPDKIDFIRMLLSPTYLGDIGEGKDWTALRAFIIELVGDVSDDDVFQANPNLDSIKDDLKKQGGSIEVLKRKLKQDCDGLNATIIAKEAVITNLEKTEKPTDEAVAIAKRAIDEHDEAIAKLRSGTATDIESERIQRELSEKQAQLIAETRRANDEFADPEKEKRDVLSKRYTELRQKLDKLFSDKSKALIDKSAKEAEIRKLESDRIPVSESANEPLVAAIRKIDSDQIEVDEFCPTCGQRLPEDKVQEAIDKAAEANAEKRKSLVERCRENKAKRREIDDLIIAAKNAIADIDDAVTEIYPKITAVQNELDEVNQEVNSIPAAGQRAETALEASLRAEISALEQNLKESRSAFQSGLSDTNSAIYRHQEEKAVYQKTIDDLAYWTRQQDNLAKERKQLADLRRSLVDAEQKRECANRFLYAKLQMLNDNVARVFGNIRIKLIQENINGGFDPVCKPYIYDSVKGESTKVSWVSGSKSEKVETGIAILEAIKKAKSLPDLPLLFDEGGEISTETFGSRLATDSQIICVKVRDGIQSPTIIPIEASH